MNYFKLFSIEEKYIVDKNILHKRYLILQKRYHPDNAKDTSEHYKNNEYSILINEAFKVLKDDFLRAKYLLKKKGTILDEHKLGSYLSYDELDKILEEYEALENINNDLKNLHSIKKAKIEICKKLVFNIGIAFQKNNVKQVIDLTIRLKYATNLLDNVNLKIRNADI